MSPTSQALHQDLIADDVFAADLGITSTRRTPVFLCGNPAMIGLPGGRRRDQTFPDTVGALALLVERGFTPRSPQEAGQHPLRGVL